jgi:N-acetylneuraminic acid mutarotase
LLLGTGLSISISKSNKATIVQSIHWTASEPTPAEIARHTLLVDAPYQQLYIIGGALSLAAKLAPVNSAYAATIMSDGRLAPWKLSSSLPISLCNTTAVITANQIMVLGGYGGPFYRYLDTVILGEVDPLTGYLIGWHTSTHSLPKRIAAHTAVEYDGSVYIIGGLNVTHPISDVYVAPIEEIDGSKNPWTPATPLPVAIHSHATVISGNVVYVIGGYGRTSAGETITDLVYYGRIGPRAVIDWKSTIPLSIPLRSSAATISGGYLYVIGGYQDGIGPSSAIFRASIQADGTITNWTSLSQEPLLLPPLYRHAAVVTRIGRIYVSGGNTGPIVNPTYLNQVLFTPLLDFEKLATPDGPVAYGDTISYTLRLTNLGVRDFTTLDITDTVTTNVSTTLEFHCQPEECQNYSDNSITRTIPGLGIGETTDLNFAVTISRPTSAPLSAPTLSQVPLVASISPTITWTQVCSPARLEVVGVGITNLVTNTLHITRPETIVSDSIRVQAAFKIQPGEELGEVTFYSGGVSYRLTGPTSVYSFMAVYEQDVQVSDTISVTVNSVDRKKARALTAYFLRGTREEYSLVGRTMNQFLCHETYTDVLKLPLPANSGDITVTAVLADNDHREQPVCLSIRAGQEITTTTFTTPSHGNHLDIRELQLSDVPTTTNEVTVIAQSPPENGESFGLVGLVAETGCRSTPTPTPTPTPPLRVLNRAQVCERVSTGSWCWYAAYINTDLHVYLPIVLKSTP